MSTLLGIFNVFDKLGEKLWQIAILIAVVFVIIALIKYPQSRWLIGTILVLAFVVGTIYCGIQLNFYYTATGGIYGQIKNLYNPNQVKITNNVEYSFENLVLTQDVGDTYSARITSDSILDLNLEEGVSYGVYVNGLPCDFSEVHSDYVIARYEYNFLDEDMNLIMNDTLTFKFVFYTNSTYLIVSTDGGSEAVKYWEYYFNKNKFIVSIDNKGYHSDSLNFTDDEVTKYIFSTVNVNEYIKVHDDTVTNYPFNCSIGSTFEISYSPNLDVYQELYVEGATASYLKTDKNGYLHYEVTINSHIANISLVDKPDVQTASLSIIPPRDYEDMTVYMDLYNNAYIEISSSNLSIYHTLYVGQEICIEYSSYVEFDLVGGTLVDTFSSDGYYYYYILITSSLCSASFE